MKKYEFTGEVKYWDDDMPVHRIRAVRNFGNVKAGQLGGWIQSEENLAHTDNAWVADEAVVLGKSHILNNGCVKENAVVMDCAIVAGNATVQGNAVVSDYGYITEYSVIAGNAMVYGTAGVHGHMVVCGDAVISDNCFLCGDFAVSGDTFLCKDAAVFSPKQYLTIGPIGSCDDFITFYRSRRLAAPEIFVKCGSFCGSLGEFWKEVQKMHGYDEYREEYRCAIELAEYRINLY